MGLAASLGLFGVSRTGDSESWAIGSPRLPVTKVGQWFAANGTSFYNRESTAPTVCNASADAIAGP